LDFLIVEFLEGFSEFILQGEEKKELNLEKKATLTFKKAPKGKTSKKMKTLLKKKRIC